MYNCALGSRGAPRFRARKAFLDQIFVDECGPLVALYLVATVVEQFIYKLWNAARACGNPVYRVSVYKDSIRKGAVYYGRWLRA